MIAQKTAAPLAAALLVMVCSYSGAARAGESEQRELPEREPAAAVPRYRLAIGGDLAAGGQGYDAEQVAGLAELGARWQWLPVLGLGGTFSVFGFGSTGRDLQARVLGLHASVHPLAGSVDPHFDPYLRFGPVYFADVRGKLPTLPTYEVSRLGVEGVLGMSFAWRHFAFGPELRYGRTNQAWEFLGVHLEARI